MWRLSPRKKSNDDLKRKLDKATEKARKKRAACEKSIDQALFDGDVDPDMDGPAGADE